MKKINLPIAAALLCAVVSGCTMQTVNQSPELTGVADITCLVNTTVDLLDGVAALDTEDGDITPDIEITVVPEASVSDGYAVFTETGTYELIYSVADSWGNAFRTTAYATVTEREVYREDILTNGFSLETGGGASVSAEGLCGSAYSFVLSGAEIAEDVRLKREYTLKCGTEYTFTYSFLSSLSGRVKVTADGDEIAERYISAGEGELSFTYTPPLSGSAEERSVSIALLLGGLEGELEFSLYGASCSRYTDDEYAAAEGFDFTGNYYERFDQATGSAYTVDDGYGVCVEITTTASDMWRGGVFVNTGVALEAGSEYTVTFDVYSENDNTYDICFQNKQWDEVILKTLSPEADGSYTVVLNNVTSENSGTLWLYIRSGQYVNKITLSNLSIYVKEGGTKTESYYISAFTTSNYDGGAGSVDCEYGTVTYIAESFGSEWGNNEISSPSFTLSGAAENFVITFKAKSSSPLTCVFAASVAGEWNTFAWENISLTAEEKEYSIYCGSANLDGIYKLIWQFGSSANAVYSDVTVTISDIKICYKSSLED